MGEFRYEGHRIAYDEYGSGERLIVLGHGRSDRPEDLRLYSMPLFARQVVALLDHLEEESAVIGGTSLGANIALELAVRQPKRAQALFIEMPVLDNALSAVA